MKVAFTSSDGEHVDQHFGTSAHFYVWDVRPDRASFLRKVSAVTAAGDEEDRTAARAAAVADCAIVCTLQIGGPAAAKLVARRVHALKTQGEVPVTEMVAKLQQVLKGNNPPPWLKKAMAAGE